MELWLREKIYNFANVLMRVPPIFLLDELLRIGLGVPQESITLNITDKGYKSEVEDIPTAIEAFISAAGNSVLFGRNFSLEHNASSYIFVYSYQVYVMIALRFLACCLGKYRFLINLNY